MYCDSPCPRFVLYCPLPQRTRRAYNDKGFSVTADGGAVRRGSVPRLRTAVGGAAADTGRATAAHVALHRGAASSIRRGNGLPWAFSEEACKGKYATQEMPKLIESYLRKQLILPGVVPLALIQASVMLGILLLSSVKSTPLSLSIHPQMLRPKTLRPKYSFILPSNVGSVNLRLPQGKGNLRFRSNACLMMRTLIPFSLIVLFKPIVFQSFRRHGIEYVCSYFSRDRIATQSPLFIHITDSIAKYVNL